MTTLNSNSRQINGPINVVRLTGNIAGIDKTIYLFMDLHYTLQGQTQCDNIFSRDVQKFFVESFHQLENADRMYDFFVEIHPTQLSKDSPAFTQNVFIYRDKYIEEVLKKIPH
jgi:hypothetical protein